MRNGKTKGTFENSDHPKPSRNGPTYATNDNAFMARKWAFQSHWNAAAALRWE